LSVINFFFLFIAAKIIGFYFLLYSFLAAFFAAMFMVFLQTLDQAEPKWKQGDGLIGTNPGTSVSHNLVSVFSLNKRTHNG